MIGRTNANSNLINLSETYSTYNTRSDNKTTLPKGTYIVTLALNGASNKVPTNGALICDDSTTQIELLTNMRETNGTTYFRHMLYKVTISSNSDNVYYNDTNNTTTLLAVKLHK